MEQESAFNELKHRLTIAPVSAYPDFSPDAGLFVLDTDASKPLGIGGEVTRGGYTTMQTPFQEGPDDNMGIVHRVLQQDYPKLRLLLETFRSVKPQVK